LHQYRFWKVPIPAARITGHTDSLSLIKTLAKIAHFAKNWYSSVYTWNHIDILREINTTIQDLQPLVYIPQHVKAHEDKKKQWHELTRPEQVNVYCDREATSALRQQMSEPHKRQSFLPLPGMSTYLQHNKQFVTGHEQKILLWATAEEEITDYYAKKYNWSRTTAKTIDWAAFETAQNGTKLDHFIPKLCCSWLPTHYHLNKREGTPDECPLCQQSETTEHLFTCPKRRAQRKLFLIQFQGLLIDLRTDPKIQQEIITGIKQLVRKTDEPTQEHDNQPVSQFPAAQQQESIGWIHLYRGFLSKRWQEDQERYTAFRDTDDDDEKKKTRWNVKVIQYLWQYAHKTWIERCQLVHDKESTRESVQARTRAVQLVTTMYRHQDSVNAQDRANIFGRSLQDRLTDTSANDLTTWYDTVLPALKRAIKDYKQQSKRGQTTIYGGPRKTRKTAAPKDTTKKRAKHARRHSSGQEHSKTRKTLGEDNNAPT
jgi:hypothetical protein